MLGLVPGSCASSSLGPVAVVSSIRPWETVTSRRSLVSSGVVTPAFECGSSRESLEEEEEAEEAAEEERDEEGDQDEDDDEEGALRISEHRNATYEGVEGNSRPCSSESASSSLRASGHLASGLSPRVNRASVAPTEAAAAAVSITSSRVMKHRRRGDGPECAANEQ